MLGIKNDFLVLGSNDAPVKIEVFLNLACPYCATFYDLVDEVLIDYIQQNKVSFIVKHFDKPREMLLPGLLLFVEKNGGDGLRVLFPDAESGEDSPKYLVGGNLSGNADKIGLKIPSDYAVIEE